MSALFKEKQRFRNPWISILLLMLGLLPPLAIYLRLVKENSIVQEYFTDLQLVILSLLIYIVVGLIFIVKLTIFMNQYGIFINFYPFLKKHVVWFSIKEANIIDCSSVNGTGINWFSKYGTAFKIKGKKGLHITLNNDKEYLIATKRPEKLKNVIESYRNVHNFK